MGPVEGVRTWPYLNGNANAEGDSQLDVVNAVLSLEDLTTTITAQIRPATVTSPYSDQSMLNGLLRFCVSFEQLHRSIHSSNINCGKNGVKNDSYLK